MGWHSPRGHPITNLGASIVTDPYLPARIRALQSDTVRRRHLELFFYLENLRNEKGVACPSCRYLAEVFDVGSSTISRWLHVLRDAGLLEWDRIRSVTKACYRFFHDYKTLASRCYSSVSHLGTKYKLLRAATGTPVPKRIWYGWQESWEGDLTPAEEDELRRSRG